jgi:hypothetical protein
MRDQDVTPDDEILPEYSLKGGVRGKYAARCAEGTSVVLLDSADSDTFPGVDSADQVRGVTEQRRKPAV